MKKKHTQINENKFQMNIRRVLERNETEKTY